MIFIETSNAYSLTNITTKLNSKPVGSIQFKSVSTKDKDKVSTKDKDKVSTKEATSKDSKKTNSEPKLNDKDKFSPFNQKVIIPPNALLNNNHFDKKQLQIPLGATVTWKNNDTIDHDIEVFHQPSLLFLNDPIGSKNLKPSDTLSIKFDHPGKYIYQCSSPNHNFMKGFIHVG